MKDIGKQFTSLKITEAAAKFDREKIMTLGGIHSARVFKALKTQYQDTPEGTLFFFVTGDKDIVIIQRTLGNDNVMFAFTVQEYKDGGQGAILNECKRHNGSAVLDSQIDKNTIRMEFSKPDSE